MKTEDIGGGGLRPHLLFLDFETRSTVDIAKCGSFKYIEDPSFDVLLLAYAWDDEPVKLVDFAQGETWPEDFLQGLRDPDVTCIAHNCAFERAVIGKLLEYTPPEHWFDTMHLTAHCGLPLGLDGVCKALGLPEDQAKMKEGKALIRYFCTPPKATKTNGGRPWNLPEHAPEKCYTFRRYCAQDVESMRTIFNLLKRWLPDETERRIWALDAKVNEKGMNTDQQFVRNAMEMDGNYKAELTEKAIAVSGIENPNSVQQVKDWLKDQEDIEVPSLNKKEVADVIASLKTDRAKQLMEIRSELSKTSTKKYDAFIRCAGEDAHVRGCFQFFGAHSGRWSGRLVQLQNLKQNHLPDLDDARELVKTGDFECFEMLYPNVTGTLSELIRTSLIAEPGEQFVVSDFSAIEARVSAWFAHEEWVLDVFRNGGDIYCATASQMFGVPVEKHGQNSELRQKGKIATLALGYGGGVNALKAFGADKMGMTDEEMQDVVDKWRDSNANVAAWWKTMENAAVRAVARQVETVDKIGGITFSYENGVLFMKLPSGRRLAYWGAAYGESRFQPGRKTLSYMGVNQQTKKWSRVETWGGKLVENCWAAGTLVCTNHGWIPIEKITCDDLIWDGFDWVKHDGAVCRGSQRTMSVDGERCTPDHKIRTTRGWQYAKDCDGLGRLPVQLPATYVADHVKTPLTVDPSGREEPVYDLLNCGERHQFVILTRKGPLIVHNCVQATARDVLREAMFALDEQGYQVIAHVHDECIVTEPITSGRTYEDMAKTMCPDIPWAKGLPLEAAGYDGDYYFKD